MNRILIACALLAGCGEEKLSAVELPACQPFRDGHWDTRLITPGASGAAPSVVAIQRMPDGSVIAGGSFDTMSGTAAKNVARWDGTSWTALGHGLAGQVTSLAVDDRGQLWATGDYFGFGKPIDGPGGPKGGSGSYLARWSGAEWTTIVQNAFSIVGVTPVDGGIAVYGSFFQQAGLPASGVGIWRDGVWTSTNLFGSDNVRAAIRNGNGLCIAGTLQTNIKEINNGVACWNGSTWSPLGNPIYNVETIARGNDGRWYIGGMFTITEGGNSRYGIARLEDDGEWHALDGGVHPAEAVSGGGGAWTAEVTSISVDGDGLVVAGHFEWIGVPKMRAYQLARWSPTSGWSAMTPPSDLFGRLSAVLATDRNTYVGGSFRRIGLQVGAGIATVDGGSAHSLPEHTLVPARLGSISDMIAVPDGIILAGRFRDNVEIGETTSTETHSLLRFDGDWGRPIEGVPIDNTVDGTFAAVALEDGYAVRSGQQLYRRFGKQHWHLVTDKPVTGPLVADGSGAMFFVLPTQPMSTIVKSTRDDTGFYAVVPGIVIAMAIYDGELVVVASNDLLGGQTVYRRHDDDWELIGAWADYTSKLVVSPTLGLVAGTQNGTRVWNGSEWRTISHAYVHDMAACSDGIVAAIDEGDGSRLAFLDDPDGEWTYYGEPRGAQYWKITPTERGIYIGTSSGGSTDSALGFARWTTLDDSGW